MTENYEEVPNMISCKDLDYLSDMFNWNYGAYKSTIDSSKIVSDEELRTCLEKASNVFHNNLNKVLTILNNGGQDE